MDDIDSPGRENLVPILMDKKTKDFEGAVIMKDVTYMNISDKLLLSIKDNNIELMKNILKDMDIKNVAWIKKGDSKEKIPI